jgi:iron(III) transport system permease protein
MQIAFLSVIFTLALTLLPWHSEGTTASLMMQAINGATWLLPLLVLTPLLLVRKVKLQIAVCLILLSYFILQGFMVTINTEPRQFGLGLGGALYFFTLIITLSILISKLGYFGGDAFTSVLVGLLIALIAVFTLWPVLKLLSEALKTSPGESLLQASITRFAHPKIWGVACLTSKSSCGAAWNTLVLAISTATCATALGLSFALIATRTGFKFKKPLRLLTILPIITPPFIISLGLILIFGRSGVMNLSLQSWFNIDLGRWIYGFNGVMLAQVFSFTPTAFLVLIGVVQGVSPTLEEAAETLRADKTRIFNTITMPLMRPGLANAFLVVFIESLADFGNPLVLGGSFGVLSTEIFFAVVGAQADFGRAAMLALILLGFALTVFLIQRKLTGGSFVTVTGKGDSGLTRSLPRWAERTVYAIALPWAALTLFVYIFAVAGAFVKVWGRDWTFTLDHFVRTFAIDGGRFTGGAWASFFTTLKLAAIAAPLTAIIGLLAAWLIARKDFKGKTALEFALMLSFCVPGTVIGVAYVLTYNIPPVEITGTGLILVICFIFRNLPVGVRSGMASVSQIDKSLDEAGVMLRASTFRVLRTITLPLMKPAIISALIYSFVRAMTTVSAVVFLVSAQYELATVYIINRAINGDYGQSVAYSVVLIVIMAIAVGLINLIIGDRKLRRG